MTVWLSRDLVLAIHDEQIAEHGGAAGLRDAGLLDSALARPLNLASYGTPDIAELGATYALAIARNHLFIDGNNLWALAASGAFFYGLTFLTILASWWLIRRSIPDGHGGIRHPAGATVDHEG